MCRMSFTDQVLHKYWQVITLSLYLFTYIYVYIHVCMYVYVTYLCMYVCVCVSIANKVLYWSPLFQTNFQDDFPVRCIVHHVLPPRHWDHAVCWQQQHALQLLVRSLRQALVPRLGRWPHDVEELLMIHSYIMLYLGYIQWPKGNKDGQIPDVKDCRDVSRRFVCLALGLSICHVGLPGGKPLLWGWMSSPAIGIGGWTFITTS